MKLVPKNKHALIRICKIVLAIDSEVTEDDVARVKTIFQQHLDSGMSPADIKKHYSIEYSDFGMFIKKCLNLSLLSTKDAVNNFYKKSGRSVTDAKAIYYKKCSFAFDPYSLPNIPGYEKLLELGVYHPTDNPNGVCRDHIVSVSYGWRNNVPPEIISHPCNCQFITNAENIAKNDKSLLTIEELKHRIETNTMSPVVNIAIHLPKTKDHKAKIGATNRKYMRITNGSHNLRILKTDTIPIGYRKGFTRKNKMVGAEGLEPPIR